MGTKTKKIIITLAAGVITLAVLFFIFGRGTLEIKPSATPAKIMIDKKIYDNKNSLSVKLLVGKHIVKIEKDGYKTFEETVKIGFLEKKEMTPTLEMTVESKDKKEIEATSKNFIEEWYTYQKQTDQEYSERIKPFMTKGFFDSTYYVNTRRPQDFKGQVSLKTSVISVTILNYIEERAEVEILRSSFEPSTDKKYEKRVRVYLVIENGKWLVNYLKPIL